MVRGFWLSGTQAGGPPLVGSPRLLIQFIRSYHCILYPQPEDTPGALSLGVKRPGREADHSPPSSDEVKYAWSYTSTPQFVFMAWCLVKHRDNFTLTPISFIRNLVIRHAVVTGIHLTWTHLCQTQIFLSVLGSWTYVTTLHWNIDLYTRVNRLSNNSSVETWSNSICM
jgi:hypothetical protein